MEQSDHLQKVERFHDMEANKYRKLRYHTGSCEGLAYVQRKKLILSSIKPNQGRVLDIGCGPGILTKELTDFFSEIYSADISKEMVKEAKRELDKKKHKSQAHFLVNNAPEICVSANKLDMVICVGLLCYIKEQNDVLLEIHRVLKNRGTAVLQIQKYRWPNLTLKIVPLYWHIKEFLGLKKYDSLDFQMNFPPYKEFLNGLENMGFQVETLQYYDFRIPFIDILFPEFSLKLGNYLFKKRHNKVLQCLSNGLIVSVVKTH